MTYLYENTDKLQQQLSRHAFCFTELNSVSHQTIGLLVRLLIRTWSVRMKAWLWNLLYPLNLWRGSLACCHWFLRVYQRWLWDPLLEKSLSSKPRVVRNRVQQSTLYTCVQRKKKKSIALIVRQDAGSSFFCSITCRDRYIPSASSQKDSDRVRQPSL